MTELIFVFFTWLVTLLVHSTLWLGGVALFTHLRPGASALLRDFLWRAALAASVITPTAQVIATEGFGWQPLGGALSIHAEEKLLAIPAATPLAPPLLDVSLEPAVFSFTDADLGPQPLLMSAALRSEVQPVHLSSSTASFTWPPVLLLLWAAVALCGILYLLRGTLQFRRHLGARQPVGESASARALRKLLERTGKRGRGIRLTASEALRVPVALGVFRREICVPQRALRDLPPTQQRAMIGHEFAHLLRHDPAWLGGFEVARRLFFFQPLFVIAQRGAHEAAEELCDAWSAQRTGDPVALAECLGEVARWLEPRSPRGPLPLAAACMARPDSPLSRRIEALLDERTEVPERTPRGLRLGACALALSAAAFLPGFAAQPAELTLEARFERIAEVIAEVQSDLAAAREEDPTQPRLALIGERLDVLRAQAERLSAQIIR